MITIMESVPTRKEETFLQRFKNIELLAITFFGNIWIKFINKFHHKQKSRLDDELAAREQEYVAHEKFT